MQGLYESAWHLKNIQEIEGIICSFLFLKRTSFRCPCSFTTKQLLCLHLSDPEPETSPKQGVLCFLPSGPWSFILYSFRQRNLSCQRPHPPNVFLCLSTENEKKAKGLLSFVGCSFYASDKGETTPQAQCSLKLKAGA